MTLQQARQFLEANGYTVTDLKDGSFRVVDSATQDFAILTSDNIIVMAGELQAAGSSTGVATDPLSLQGMFKNISPVNTVAASGNGAMTKPEWWPAGVPWPPKKWMQQGIDKDGKPIYKEVFDYEAFSRIQEDVRLGQPESGKERFPLPEGQPRTIKEGGQVYSWDSTLGDYRRVATGEGVGLPGEIVKGEDVGGPEGSFFIRDPDGSLRPYTPEKAEESTEQYLGTVEEGGWLIDQYGYTGADGKKVITARQPRQPPLKDPILSLDDLISQALVDVDFNDPNWAKDADYVRAQSLLNFKNQPTSQERLQMALQIAQSPSDYLTLVALYTGAIQRESPAKVGERIAPLAPILQMMAQQFFLDIPGINHVPTQAETADINPATGKPYAPGDTLETATEEEEGVDGAGGAGAGAGVGGKGGEAGLPAPWDTTAANGRYYDSINNVWEDWDAFVARTGYGKEETYPGGPVAPVTPVPENRPTIPMAGSLTGQTVPGLLGGGVAVPSQEGPSAPVQGPGGAPAIGQQVPGLLGTQPGGGSSGGVESLIKTLVSAVKSLGGTGQGQTTAKPLTTQQQVQAAQGTPLSSKLASSLGINTIGETQEQRKRRLGIPSFQAGGVVPGYLGQPRLAQVEGGETVLTPEQIQALLQQSGMFGPVYRPDLQQLPQFLTQPRRVSLAELTGGALRPRSLQTIRGQSPTQRMLTLEMAKGFGVPAEDFLEEERMATSIGGPRRMARFQPSTIRTGR